MKIHGSIYCLFTLLTAAACSATSGEEEGGKAAAPLAQVQREDGMSITFREVEPGELTVTGSGPYGALSPAQLFPNLREMKATELFTALAQGAAAPPELVAAQTRVDQVIATKKSLEPAAGLQAPDVSLSDLKSPRAPEGVGVVQSAISADDFETIYCGPASAFPINDCKTNRTGDTGWFHDQDASLMQITGSPYRGGINLQLQYHNVWGWHDSGDVRAEEDEIWFVLGYGSNKERRAQVYNAAGDGYHREVHGNL
jgi:hypothetical protein